MPNKTWVYIFTERLPECGARQPEKISKHSVKGVNRQNDLYHLLRKRVDENGLVLVDNLWLFKRLRQSSELGNGVAKSIISGAGYKISTLFVKWNKHFLSLAKPLPRSKILLLLDGQTTQSNLEALHLVTNNGIIMLQLPFTSFSL